MARHQNVQQRAAYVAAGLAVASAATTAYWLLGGTALPDAVGGYPEELVRTRSAAALAVGLLVVGAKAAAGIIALALVHPIGPMRRLLVVLGSAGGLLLTVYGGLLVIVGALVLADVIHPEGAVDRRVHTWHVALWDLWFLVWGLTLGLAAWSCSRALRSHPDHRPQSRRASG